MRADYWFGAEKSAARHAIIRNSECICTTSNEKRPLTSSMHYHMFPGVVLNACFRWCLYVLQETVSSVFFIASIHLDEPLYVLSKKHILEPRIVWVRSSKVNRIAMPRRAASSSADLKQTKRMRWRSSEGHAKVLAAAQHINPPLRILIESENWHSACQTNSAKLPVKCLACGHESQTATVASLLAMRAPRCFCPRVGGSIPWKTDVGRTRLLQILHDKWGDDKDISEITPEWWRNHVQGANTCLPLTCRRCGHRSTSCAITTLQQGGEPGCFCNGRVFWKSLEGRERILDIIAAKYGGTKDVTAMTTTWWFANVVDQSSTIRMRCTTCEYINCKSRIGDVANGDGVGCWCKGVPYEGREGYDRVHYLLDQNSRINSSAVTYEWWCESRITAHSKLPLSCRDCGHSSSDLTINHLQQGGGPACFCNGGVLWASQNGFDKFRKVLHEFFSDIIDATDATWEWWEQHVPLLGKDTVMTCLRCLACGHRCQTTRLSHVASMINKGGIACECNGSALWAGEPGRLRLLRNFEGTHYDTSVMTSPWWITNIHGVYSKIIVKCTRCGETCSSTTIASFTQRFSINCGCRLKTEHLLRTWLVGTYGEASIESQCVVGRNIGTDRPLKMDFAVHHNSRKTFIELDGELGHFGRGWHGEVVTDVPQRDLLKERMSLDAGISVIRVLQMDIWHNRFDWQGYILRSLEMTWAAEVPAVILPTGVIQYTTGIYAELRS